jgi:hypothetical protein
MRGRKNPPLDLTPLPEGTPLTFDTMAHAYLEDSTQLGVKQSRGAMLGRASASICKSIPSTTSATKTPIATSPPVRLSESFDVSGGASLSEVILAAINDEGNSLAAFYTSGTKSYSPARWSWSTRKVVESSPPLVTRWGLRGSTE